MGIFTFALMKGQIRIGTSGWHYKHWLGTFYPEGTKPAGQLPYYLKFFNTVELNNSFYHLPPKNTFANWKAAVPDDFLFVVKASRFITHMKKLKDPAESLVNFMENVQGLDEKLGPILFQLPPGWKINTERLQEFLEKLPAGFRYVFEFRNETWYDEAIYSLLQQHNCAFCIYELAGHMSPLKVTADFVYLRLHGPGENKYQGSYSNETLNEWASQCKEWAQEGKDVFVYFDNDEKGYAAFNAQKMLEMV
jgi:uncharacterized protein YecE (DUF72 family)